MPPGSKAEFLQDRVLGCVLGGALGDAWGGLTEGGRGPKGLEGRRPLRLSDDTQLTLATCESILDYGDVDPENVAANFLRWFQAGRVRGIGSSTLKAMRDLSVGVHWALAGTKGEYSAGNGAAMRIAPLAFILDASDNESRTKIRDVCRITHHNDETYLGSLAVIIAIQSVLSNHWSGKSTFLELAIDHLPDSRVRDRMISLRDCSSPISEIASSFGATGYVVDTVPLALYCAQRITEFSLEDVISQAAAVKGDSDTIASITGQLAGVVVGSRGLPHERVAEVEEITEVSDIGQRFAEFVQDRQRNRD